MQWNGNLAHHPSRLGIGAFNKPICSSRDYVLSIGSKGEASTAAFVPARLPKGLDEALIIFIGRGGGQAIKEDMSSRETKSDEWADWMNSESKKLCWEREGTERCEHGRSNCTVK